MQLFTGWRAVKSYNFELFKKNMHTFLFEPHKEVVLVPSGHKVPNFWEKAWTLPLPLWNWQQLKSWDSNVWQSRADK